ncbi:hypothetical protein B0H10DRAFT_2228401 [Mycena sp. CBHHK59/15]|nr:hypothetical protein B0H10DRAFT_2228401 [Mycena sp. CBHHK59/15]
MSALSIPVPLRVLSPSSNTPSDSDLSLTARHLHIRFLFPHIRHTAQHAPPRRQSRENEKPPKVFFVLETVRRCSKVFDAMDARSSTTRCNNKHLGTPAISGADRSA